MQSTLSASKRPLNEVEENDAFLRRMHHEEEKEQQRKIWTPSEDWRLRELVAIFGPRKWRQIGEIIGRTAKTCRTRWCNYLDPKINKDKFSAEEEKKLLEAHKELGSKWSLIAKRFHLRTDRAVMKHFNKLSKKNLEKQSTSSVEAMEARSSEGNQLPKFIDFLGVGDT